MSILWNFAEQGTQEWLDARRGVITGSRAKVARERSNGLTKQQQKYVDAIRAGRPDALELAGYKRSPTSELVAQAIDRELPLEWSDAAKLYAMDVARERAGGTAQGAYTTAAMRLGTEQEAPARVAYEDRSGCMVEKSGFACTEDRKFGCSVDGLILGDSTATLPTVWECKTMVSSDTLFTAVVEGDTSEFDDQCLFNTWLLTAKGCVLTLHVWDLPSLTRDIWIPRDEAAIERLEADMLAFEALVTSYETILLAKMVGGARSTQPWDHAPASSPPSQKSPARVPEPSF